MLGSVGRPRFPTQFFLHGPRDERSLVLVPKHFADSLRGRVPADASRLQFAYHSQASPTFDFSRGPRVRARHLAIVETAGLEKMSDGSVDLFLGVMTVEQPASAFRDRQGASGEQVERVEVSGGHYPPKRMISDCTTPRLCAISSRAISAVVAMP